MRSFATFAVPLMQLRNFSNLHFAKLLLAQHNCLDSRNSDHCNHDVLRKDIEDYLAQSWGRGSPGRKHLVLVLIWVPCYSQEVSVAG